MGRSSIRKFKLEESRETIQEVSADILASEGELERIHFFLSLYLFSRDNPNSLHKGIEAQFLVDTGAHVSIINYSTFRVICDNMGKLDVKPTLVRLRAAQDSVMPIMGTVELTFYYDLERTHSFTHRFFVAADHTIKRNLLGMDAMIKQCVILDLYNGLYRLVKHPEAHIELLRSSTKAFPFFSRLFPVIIKKPLHIQKKTQRVYYFEKPQNMRYIPKFSSFLPDKAIMNSELSVQETLTTEERTTRFPLLVENHREDTITIPKGRIGYITFDPIYKKDTLPYYV